MAGDQYCDGGRGIESLGGTLMNSVSLTEGVDVHPRSF